MQGSGRRAARRGRCAAGATVCATTGRSRRTPAPNARRICAPGAARTTDRSGKLKHILWCLCRCRSIGAEQRARRAGRKRALAKRRRRLRRASWRTRAAAKRRTPALSWRWGMRRRPQAVRGATKKGGEGRRGRHRDPERRRRTAGDLQVGRRAGHGGGAGAPQRRRH